MTCAGSSHTFAVSDSGIGILRAMAECYNDWPAGLADSIKAPGAGPGWVTDPLRCAVIRAAAGHGHKGKVRDGQGKYAGFALKGDLDASAVPHLRLQGVVVATASKLTLGADSSVSRVLAGAVKMNEGGMAANAVGTTFSAGNTMNVTNRSVSSYTINWRFKSRQPRPPKRSLP